jgi:hypothetical protein
MTTTIRRPPATGPAWGARSQIGAAIKDLADLKGNNDGIWDNEDQAAGTTGGFLGKNPLALKAKAAASVGVTAADEIQVLKDFVAERERAWQDDVVPPHVKDQLNGGDLFAAQKAIMLARTGRRPDQVVERFVDMPGGKVGAVDVPPARIFTQHFAPYSSGSGAGTGDVVVMSPGFLESGRAFQQEIDRLNAAGVYVVVMDHQWAGHTDGKKGGIESGESIALHTAAVVGDAARVGRQRYGDDLSVTLVGESMGAGPGAFGAAIMARAGLLGTGDALNPVGDVDLFLQAPYFGATPNAINAVLQMAAKAPFLNRIAAPGLGLPDFVEDDVGEHKIAQHIVSEDIRGRTQAFKASDTFIAHVEALVDTGVRPGGRVFFVHDAQDPLADPARARALADKLGDQATWIGLQGGDHGLSASDPDVVQHLIDHLKAKRAARSNAAAT